jgi:hypothetical protein
MLISYVYVPNNSEINKFDDLRLHAMNLRVEFNNWRNNNVFDGPVISRWSP